MSSKSPEFFSLFRITNLKTGQTYEARGYRNTLVLAGLAASTPAAQMRNSKKWKLEEVAPPEKWDQAAYRRELYKKTSDRYRLYEAKKLAQDPLYEKRKQAKLRGWKNYDGSQFTAEQHERMLIQSCDICGTESDIVVDHCHETMYVRGSLCRKCNLALGHANDDIGVLKSMINYIERHRNKIYD